jgi:hypothetical protein
MRTAMAMRQNYADVVRATEHPAASRCGRIDVAEKSNGGEQKIC